MKTEPRPMTTQEQWRAFGAAVRNCGHEILKTCEPLLRPIATWLHERVTGRKVRRDRWPRL